MRWRRMINLNKLWNNLWAKGKMDARSYELCMHTTAIKAIDDLILQEFRKDNRFNHEGKSWENVIPSVLSYYIKHNYGKPFIEAKVSIGNGESVKVNVPVKLDLQLKIERR